MRRLTSLQCPASQQWFPYPFPVETNPLITPYGGTLVDLVVPEAERADVLARAKELPSIRLSERARHDLDLLAVGAFSPLRTFLGRADHDRVLAEMRLSDGTLWPIPILLPVAEDDLAHVGREVALRDSRNDLRAVMTVEDVFPFDAEAEARGLFGQADPAHPLVAEMAGWGKLCVSGPLRVLDVPLAPDFAAFRLTPRQVRERLASLGNPRVVAFQTRNPLHRSHEELTRRAAQTADATLLLHPAVGMTKPGDVDHYTRVRSYRALVEHYYDPVRTVLALLPLAMRMAGPREALWHALIRRNHGASHFIVGRDHAGPGKDSTGKPFFGPLEAQQLARAHEAETGVAILAFEEMVYLPDEDRYEEATRIPAGTKTLAISGTQVRDDYLARGRTLPAWFTRPETAAILAETFPPRDRQGFCIWFTGLSGAGKSATAEALTAILLERGRRATVLDGDVVRTNLSRGLGFTREDRDANIRRIGFVAAEVVRHQGVVLCAAVSPYRSTRNECRGMVGADRFVEVFVDTPLDVCEGRDTKGLYAKARRGEVAHFTGISDPYEPPVEPEVRLVTEGTTALANAQRIVAWLEEHGFLVKPGASA